MAVTQSRPFTHPHGPAAFDAGVEAREPRAAWALGIALLAAVAYAAFAHGAIRLEDESDVQLGLALVALPTLAAVLFRFGLRFDVEPPAAWGIGLLAGFGAFCALSIVWSIAPDNSWIEANRALAYALVVALAVTLGSSLPRAAERVAMAYVALAVVVAVYALLGKLAPWLYDQTSQYTRLRAPIYYANGLALFCALAVPLAVRLASDPERDERVRLAALVALLPLISAVLLTYSRGGLLALVTALGLLLAIGPDRARILATTALGALACLPGVAVALVRDDLTTPRLAVSERTDAGIMALVALALGIAFLVVAGRVLFRNDERVVLPPRISRVLPRIALGLVLVVAVVGITLTVANDGGGDAARSITSTAEDRQDDPARLLQTNSTNRADWWNEAVGAWTEHPFLGNGAGSFPALHLLYRDNGLQVKQPHSVPLEFLTETGIIGALLALGALGLLAMAAVGRVMRAPPSTERAFSGALLAAAAAWGVQMLVDWDWDIPAVTIPMLVFIGVAAARPPSPDRALVDEATPISERTRAPLLAVGAAVLCLFAVSAYLPALSDRWTSEALDLVDKGDRASLRDAAEKADAASRINPFSVEPVLAAAQVADRAGDPRASLKYYLDAVERQPDNASAWSRLALFQFRLDDSPGALRSIGIARSLDPRSVFTGFVAFGALYDETRSASATGTPLPIIAPPSIPRPPAPAAGTGPSAPIAPGQPPAGGGAPPAAPAPAPAPSPAPQAPSAPGQSFELDG